MSMILHRGRDYLVSHVISNFRSEEEEDEHYYYYKSHIGVYHAIPKTLWRSVPNHPDYDISTTGEIRNRRTGRILKQHDDGRGYLKITLNGRHYKVHRLMCETFIPWSATHKYHIHHKNYDRHDNRIINLTWELPEVNSRNQRK